MKSPVRIPLYKPDIKKADIAAVLTVLKSGWISHRGPVVSKFEQAFARQVGANCAVAVSSGTAALYCALRAQQGEAMDMIVVPGLTYMATANAVRNLDVAVKFADVDEDSWVVTRDTLGRISTIYDACVPVHLYGYPVEDLPSCLVEDCAESLGMPSRVATRAWSFFANKTITCGEGGMVTTDSAHIRDMVRSVSQQGRGMELLADEYVSVRPGWNFRMTAMQAALGLSQLRRLGRVLEKKRRIAQWYRAGLKKFLPISFQADHPAHTHWLVSARFRERDSLVKHLRAAGVETRPVFPAMGDTPVAHRIAADGLSLPSWPGLGRWQVDYVIEKVKEFYR